MADKKDQSQEEQGSSHALPITIHKQYIRDFSFENPGAPETLQLQNAPEVEINIDVQARKIEDENLPNLFEGLLRIRIVTTEAETTNMVFVAELDYATLLTIGPEVPEERHHPILFIEVPRYAYPYASQILSTACTQGGFPPMFLKPIDFHAMYLERHKDEIEASHKEAEAREAASS